VQRDILVALVRALMAVELLNTVSIVSFAYLAVTLIVSYLLAVLIGRKVSLVDRLVLWWIVWDAVVHLTLVCDITQQRDNLVTGAAGILQKAGGKMRSADARILNV